MSNLPTCNEDKPNQPGLYLGLFHGRNDPNEQLEDWGSNGPLIGPLKHVHTTYATHIKLEFEQDNLAREYGFNPDQMIDLDIQDGMVYFKDHWYGDWTVFYYHVPELPLLKDIRFSQEVSYHD